MPDPETFLSFDLGATSGRAILGTVRRGCLTLTEIHRFRNEPVECGGSLHWDILRIWHEMRCALASLDRIGVGPVCSVGIDAWGVDYALLDARGELRGNPYHYRDRRVEGMMDEALTHLGRERVYDVTGIQFMPINTLYQLYAEAKRNPRLLESAACFLTIPDLFNYWLTGQIACEFTNATTTQLYDRRSHNWAAELLQELRIPTHLFGRVAPPGTVLGGLRPEFNGTDALRAAAVVAPACHDTASAVAAVRLDPKTAFLSSGTWSLLGAAVPAAVVSEPALRFNFTNEGGVCASYLLLKNITGLWLLERCLQDWKSRGNDHAYEDLLAGASKEPGLEYIFDPDDPAFVRPPDMPAAIDSYCRRTGQRKPDSPAAYTRAILDSLALKYRFVLRQIEQIESRRFQAIRVIGGGSRIALLNQLTADATNRSVLAGPVEAAALGNIVMQLAATGSVSVDGARALVERAFPPAAFQPHPNSGWDRAYGRFEQMIANDSPV